MKDGELRGFVLEKFYEIRNQPHEFVDPFRLPDLDSIDPILLFNICGQLGEYGLLRWKPIRTMTSFGGMGHISAKGVDIVEGTARSPITVILHDQRISISQSSNVQIGNSNTIVGAAGIESKDLEKLVSELGRHLAELRLDARQQQRAEAQIAILKTEVAGDSDPAIVTSALRALRDITLGAIASLIASATQPTIWHWIHQVLMGVGGS